MTKLKTLVFLTILLLTSTTHAQVSVGFGVPAKSLSLTRFDIHFDGGSPQQLAESIRGVLKEKFNTIIGEDTKGIVFPKFSMQNVDLSELFEALKQMNIRYEENTSPGMQLQLVLPFGFKTAEQHPNDNSIWVWFNLNAGQKQQFAPKVCRFFSLAAEIDHGISVDDVTTAIQSGWKMMDESADKSANLHEKAQMSYHRETKLLIVVGDDSHIRVVTDALSTLASAETTESKNGKSKPQAEFPGTNAASKKP